MNQLNYDMMTLITTSLDLKSLKRLFQTNQQWFTFLSTDQIWITLLNLVFQYTQPFPDMTYQQSYLELSSTDGNVCEFCWFPTVGALCDCCFDEAWPVVQFHYGEGCIREMADDAFYSRSADILTLEYAGIEQANNDDRKEAKYVVLDVEAYDESFESEKTSLYSRMNIDLTSYGYKFWDQAEQAEQAKNCQPQPGWIIL